MKNIYEIGESAKAEGFHQVRDGRCGSIVYVIGFPQPWELVDQLMTRMKTSAMGTHRLAALMKFIARG